MNKVGEVTLGSVQLRIWHGTAGLICQSDCIFIKRKLFEVSCKVIDLFVKPARPGLENLLIRQGTAVTWPPLRYWWI